MKEKEKLKPTSTYIAFRGRLRKKKQIGKIFLSLFNILNSSLFISLLQCVAWTRSIEIISLHRSHKHTAYLRKQKFQYRSRSESIKTLFEILIQIQVITPLNIKTSRVWFLYCFRLDQYS